MMTPRSTMFSNPVDSPSMPKAISVSATTLPWTESEPDDGG